MISDDKSTFRETEGKNLKRSVENSQKTMQGNVAENENPLFSRRNSMMRDYFREDIL